MRRHLSILTLLGCVAAGEVPVVRPTDPTPAVPAATAPVIAALPLRGQGRYTYFWFKIYDVRCYLPAGVAATAALGEHPRRLSFTWLRGCTAKEQAEANIEHCAKRLGNTPKAEVDAGVAAINPLWPEVKENDVLDLIYRPGVGTTMALNGRDLGTVPGAAFAKVQFSIWLGDDPIDSDLRKKLLGIK